MNETQMKKTRKIFKREYGLMVFSATVSATIVKDNLGNVKDCVAWVKSEGKVDTEYVPFCIVGDALRHTEKTTTGVETVKESA